mmetsp:Transcript_30541/g.42531  ORF Transcript_30541/g.42531 Transcript_30541/m.42531 type:complete len:91 (+) Transcript_30541:35-307(+)
MAAACLLRYGKGVHLENVHSTLDSMMLKKTMAWFLLADVFSHASMKLACSQWTVIIYVASNFYHNHVITFRSSFQKLHPFFLHGNAQNPT